MEDFAYCFACGEKTKNVQTHKCDARLRYAKLQKNILKAREILMDYETKIQATMRAIQNMEQEQKKIVGLVMGPDANG